MKGKLEAGTEIRVPGKLPFTVIVYHHVMSG